MWYTEGKITVTNKSPTVSATGTQWSVSRHGVLPGMIFIGPDGKLYEIQRVNSDTSLALSAAYSGPTAKDQAYAIITTYEGDLTQFSAKFSNLLASFGGNRQDLLNWMTAKGDVSITKDDGSKLTVPSLDKVNSSLSGTVKNGGYGQIVPARISGPIGARRYCKIAESPISATGATGVHFVIVGGRNYGSPGMDLKYVYFSGRGSTTTALHARGLEILSLGVTPSGGDIEFGTLYNKTIDRWELWISGPAFNVPSITLLGSIRESPMLDVVPMSDYKWQAAPDGYKAYPIKNTYSDYNVTVDGNGFLKAASPIARLASSPESMQDDYLSGGFSLSGCAAVNGEAAGVSAERVSTGVYKVTGALGFAEEGWNIEVPQDVNGNRLCFVETDTAEDGTITVKVSKRRFDIDTAAIVAGEPMDIPAGRWIDLRLEMPVRKVEEAPEAVEETAALENVNVDPI
ncbi:hypothetical protein AB3M75_07475 [Serratia ureilytica]|uniref:phage tail fiber protein n=1 Tax=Serratia ureilytica TaxID=300181 RepID=UPI0037168F42